MYAIIEGIKIELNSRNQLIATIDNMIHMDYNEIWIKGKGESSLCTMTNPSHAFFMYLRFDGDSGFRSNNSTADKNQTQDFRLSNGQIDQYPETWLTERARVREVILKYYDTGEMDTSLDWIQEE